MFLQLNVISLFLVTTLTFYTFSLSSSLLTSSNVNTLPSISSKVTKRRSISRLDDGGNFYGAMRNPPRIEMPVVPPFVKILRKEYRGGDWRISRTTTESQLSVVEIEETTLDYDESSGNLSPTTTIATPNEEFVKSEYTIEYPNADDSDDYAEYESVPEIYNQEMTSVVPANESTLLLPLETQITETLITNEEQKETTLPSQSTSNPVVLLSPVVTESETLNSTLNSRGPKLLFDVWNNESNSEMTEYLNTEAGPKNESSSTTTTSVPPFNSMELLQQSPSSIPSSSSLPSLPPTHSFQEVNKTLELLPVLEIKSKNKEKKVESLLPRSKDESPGKTKGGGGGGLFQSIMNMAREKTKLINSTFTQLASVLLGTSQNLYKTSRNSFGRSRSDLHK